MRQLTREQRGAWFAAYAGKTELLDDDGRRTGEWVQSYDKPFFKICTVSPEAGNTFTDGFGLGEDLDRTMIIAEIGTGIDDHCIAWVDIVPETDASGNLVLASDGNPATPNNYVITKVAESYNLTNIALKKVE